MSGPGAGMPAAAQDMCGLDANALFAEADLEQIWAEEAFASVGGLDGFAMDMLPDLPVEGLLDEQMAEDAAFGGRGGGDGHGLEQRRSGLSVDDSSAGAGSANGTTPMPGHLQALGGSPAAKAPHCWSPGPGLAGPHGSGFVRSNSSLPSPSFDGAHHAYQQLFDMPHAAQHHPRAVPNNLRHGSGSSDSADALLPHSRGSQPTSGSEGAAPPSFQLLNHIQQMPLQQQRSPQHAQQQAQPVPMQLLPTPRQQQTQQQQLPSQQHDLLTQQRLLLQQQPQPQTSGGIMRMYSGSEAGNRRSPSNAMSGAGSGEVSLSGMNSGGSDSMQQHCSLSPPPGPAGTETNNTDGTSPSPTMPTMPNSFPIVAGRGRGRDGGRSTLAAEKSKERHRAAQRKYRQRQRAKTSETEQRFEVLQKQLKEMRMKEAKLLERNNQLERSLAAGNPGGLGAPPPTPVKVEVVDPPAWGNRYKLNDATWELIKESLGGSKGDDIAFTVHEDRPLSLTREKICSFTLEEYKSIWRDYVNSFAVCMLHAKGDVNSPAYMRLLKLLTEMRALKSTFCIMRPDLLSAYAQSVTAANGMPSPEFWQIIADSIEFSVDQLHKVRLIRNQALLNMGSLMASRRNILHRLSHATDPTQRLVTMDTIDSMSTKPLAEHLDMLLREENSFVAEISINAVSLLSPLQHAHLVTMSFPYGPNVLALFNILSDRLRGTAPVQEVLRAGAAAAPGAIRPLHLALQDLQNSPGGLPQPLAVNQYEAHILSAPPGMCAPPQSRQ